MVDQGLLPSQLGTDVEGKVSYFISLMSLLQIVLDSQEKSFKCFLVWREVIFFSFIFGMTYEFDVGFRIGMGNVR